MFETTKCPNCQTSLSGGARYCAKCGYGTKDGEPRRVLFDWKLIAVMIFLVPLATLGTCLGWLTADGRNYGDLKWLSIPLNIDFFSIAIGVVMILTNLVMLAIKRQK